MLLLNAFAKSCSRAALLALLPMSSAAYSTACRWPLVEACIVCIQWLYRPGVHPESHVGLAYSANIVLCVFSQFGDHSAFIYTVSPFCSKLCLLGFFMNYLQSYLSCTLSHSALVLLLCSVSSINIKRSSMHWSHGYLQLLSSHCICIMALLQPGMHQACKCPVMAVA